MERHETVNTRNENYSPRVKGSMLKTKVGLMIPQLTLTKTAQMGRHGTVNTRSQQATVQFLLEVTFLLNSFCSNTFLASLPEWSNLGKTRTPTLCLKGKSDYRLVDNRCDSLKY